LNTQHYLAMAVSSTAAFGVLLILSVSAFSAVQAERNTNNVVLRDNVATVRQFFDILNKTECAKLAPLFVAEKALVTDCFGFSPQPGMSPAEYCAGLSKAVFPHNLNIRADDVWTNNGKPGAMGQMILAEVSMGGETVFECDIQDGKNGFVFHLNSEGKIQEAHQFCSAELKARVHEQCA
jgi:hypothetical protein